MLTPKNCANAGNRTLHHIHLRPGCAMHWRFLNAYDHVRHTLQRTASRRKRLYDTKAANRKFPVGSWVLRYYPPAAQKKLGFPWVGPQQVVRQAGHTVGIQKGPDTPIICIHVDDLKLCPTPGNACWTLGPSSAKSLCASTVAFRPGSIVTNSDSTRSVIVSTCDNTSDAPAPSASRCKLDKPIDLKDHILSPFFVRKLCYQGCQFHSIAHHISCAMQCYTDYDCSLPVFGNGPDTSRIFRQIVFRPLTGSWNVALCYRKYINTCASLMRPLRQHWLTPAHSLSVYNAQRRGGGGRLCDAVL